MNQITISGKKPAGASLAELAGGWSEKEALEFEESVRVFEEIDEAIWSDRRLSMCRKV